MRLLVDHIIRKSDDNLKVEVVDKPGAGGANHHYLISGFNLENNKSAVNEVDESSLNLSILFQNGTILENGVNGVTQEVLLAVIIDRLRSFQNGEFACRENEKALTHLEEAMHWLQQRTINRLRRGVEGTHQK